MNRVRNTARKYKMENGRIWLVGGINGDITKRLVPPIEDRRAIIMKQHMLGHFGARENYNELKPKFYWRKMLEDISKITKRCG